MTYLIPTRKRKALKSSLKPALLIFLGLAVFILIFFSLLNTFFTQAGAGVKQVGALGRVFNFFETKNILIAENENLKKKVTELTFENAERDALYTENQNLLTIIGRTTATSSLVYARVIQKPGVSPYDILVIDAGENENLQNGNQIVLMGIVVGEITEVNKTFSKATLFSTPGKVINVLVGGKKIQAEAKGIGGGAFEMQIPQGIDVKQGDSILFPADPTKIFGRVISIEANEEDAFKQVFFSSPENPYELGWVQVRKN